jgi:hypothetical protein
MNRRMVIAVLALLVFGVVRMPFEVQLEKDHRAAYFHGAKLDLSLRAKIGQMGFLAALSGFRAFVADVLWLHAHALWERTEWGPMKVDLDAVTSLQPRCLLFWSQASWHMAFNASVSAFEDKKKQPREALRLKARDEYYKLGEDYLLRGIENNPDVYNLYADLGNLYQWKMKEHCKAADMYAKASAFADAPVFYHRFYYYELAQCPGHEREAYEALLKLYKAGEREHLPTLLKWLGILQEKLNVPADQKIYIPPAANP